MYSFSYLRKSVSKANGRAFRKANQRPVTMLQLYPLYDWSRPLVILPQSCLICGGLLLGVMERWCMGEWEKASVLCNRTLHVFFPLFVGIFYL